ncbi:hypothetical protein M153_1144000414, partial [Pseudoloma neurophilia]
MIIGAKNVHILPHLVHQLLDSGIFLGEISFLDDDQLIRDFFKMNDETSTLNRKTVIEYLNLVQFGVSSLLNQSISSFDKNKIVEWHKKYADLTNKSEKYIICEKIAVISRAVEIIQNKKPRSCQLLALIVRNLVPSCK